MVIEPGYKREKGSGLRAPAPLIVAFMLTAAGPVLAQGQARRQQQAPARPPAQRPALPAPDASSSLKLLWSTMAAVDQANKTGNYSVLRDLGSAGFQANNNAANLAGVFAQIRDRRVDLSDTLLVVPVFEIPPTVDGSGLLRMRGSFAMRPVGVNFDLLYQWDQGWRLHGVSVVPFIAQVQTRR